MKLRAALTLLVVMAAASSGQTPDSSKSTMRIIGVFDARTGDPIDGVQVSGASGDYVVTTGTGTARLDLLGLHGPVDSVGLRKIGYQPKQIIVSRADTAPITEVLEPIVELAPVITTETYHIERDAGQWKGFEERCKSKSVTCVRDADLQQKPSANLADFIVHADGVTIGTCGGGRGRNGQCGAIAMHSLMTPPAYCQPTFFVDGVKWDTRIGSPIDLAPGTAATAPFTPTNVKAVEVYPPERNRPLRFQGDPVCGAVVIWTK